ncbi:MAG: ATP synthase subunit I [Desulfococcaceae bacterium]|jgi:F1F0 ATPase subunit 2|nr:ATP synthase subunit I [Desulfococcaceae bacterium]
MMNETMNEMLHLIPVLMTGVLLGVIFFGGLWWTVQKGFSAKHTGLWFSGSLLLRMSLVLVGFYFVSEGHWERLLVCLSGFFTARLIVTLRLRSGQARLTGLPIQGRDTSAKETGHAA